MCLGFCQKSFVLGGLVLYKMIVIDRLLVGSLLSVFVSSFIWSAFSSKIFVLKFSIFACGIGFKMLGGLSVIVGIYRAITYIGICNVTGEWSELRLWSLFVVDVYKVLLVVFMKYPSIRIVWL